MDVLGLVFDPAAPRRGRPLRNTASGVSAIDVIACHKVAPVDQPCSEAPAANPSIGGLVVDAESISGCAQVEFSLIGRGHFPEPSDLRIKSR